MELEIKNHRIELLDHGYVELVEHWGSDARIIESARMSTQKGFNGFGEWVCGRCNAHDTIDPLADGKLTEHPCPLCGLGVMTKTKGDEGLLRRLWKFKHSTPFEMAGITIEVQAPIFVFREWHRHRVPFGYSEASARYAPLPDFNYVPTLERCMRDTKDGNKQAGAADGAAELTPEAAEAWRKHLADFYEDAERFYQYGLKIGIPKELARIVLPVGRYSKMRATGNLRGWLNFLALRDEKTAQWEIQQYAGLAVREMLKELFPWTMSLYLEREAA